MLAYFQGNVTFISFSTFVGLTLFATAYLAGITSISGGIVAGMIGIGGMVPLVLREAFGMGGQWFAVIAGLGLVVTLITNPEGIVGPVHQRLQRRRRDRTP